MRLTKINLFFSIMIICLFAGSTFAQSDEYYYETEIKYSDKLKAGMEFTWEISKYTIDISSENLGLDQATTVTSTTVYTSYETTTWDDSTTTHSEENDYPEFPDISLH